MLDLIGLRGLRGLSLPARRCGVDLFDRTGVDVGGDVDLHEGERCLVSHGNP
jgi:hypothetical protein